MQDISREDAVLLEGVASLACERQVSRMVGAEALRFYFRTIGTTHLAELLVQDVRRQRNDVIRLENSIASLAGIE